MFPRIRIIDLLSEVAQAGYGLLHPSADWRDSHLTNELSRPVFWLTDLISSLEAWRASKILSPLPASASIRDTSYGEDCARCGHYQAVSCRLRNCQHQGG